MSPLALTLTIIVTVVLVLASAGILIVLARTLQRSAEEKHRPRTRRTTHDGSTDEPPRTDDAD